MLFNSFAFAVFLPMVFILYWLIPQRFRWVLLLAASYYFYMSWNAIYAILILFTTVISYFCGLALERTKKRWLRNVTLIVALSLCLGVLFIFKYYNFTVNTLRCFINFSPYIMKFALPVGISFYTFQTLSYVIDVYKGGSPTEHHFGIYATFVIFFPQLIAGPIERASRLIPQIKKKHSFDIAHASWGGMIIIWGLFKKMVVADNLAVYADMVYGNITSYQGFSIVLATLCFTIQIYCDFSGYTDIARGSAKLFGIELMDNFKCPYFATSVKDFWSRWHISLSTWFRDYVYIPMGGNRVSKARNCFNVLITFLVSGLWHGASWNFVVWGGLHGLAQIYENAFGIKPKREEENDIFTIIRIIVVFAFVSMAWIFFRVQDVHQGFYAIKNMFVGVSHIWQYISQGITAMGLHNLTNAGLMVLYIVPLTVFDIFSLKTDVIEWFVNRNAVVQNTVTTILIVTIMLYGYAGQSTFVYFQF